MRDLVIFGSLKDFTNDNPQAFRKTVEQSEQMDTQKKSSWENLPEAHRHEWTQHVIKFYPPNTVSPQEAAELARDEYNEADSLLPIPEVCEAD